MNPPEDLANGYFLQTFSHPSNIAWLDTSDISEHYLYHIRRSIWISAVAQGKLIFNEQVRQLKNSSLNMGGLNNDMHKWFHLYDYLGYPNPGLWCLYEIDQLSAMDAQLKFLRPLYDTAMRRVEGTLATSTGSIDNETSMIEFDYKADKIFQEFDIIRSFTKKSIRYVKSKQDLFDVDRRCGFQK